MAHQRGGMIAGIFFLAGALAVLSVELRLVQRETDGLARRLSVEIARMGGTVWGLETSLWRVREEPEEAMSLFDREGRMVAQVSRAGEEEHGLLVTMRAGVRDLRTGREILHLVVHRDIHTALVRAGAGGLAAALLAGLVHWLAGRRRREETPAAA